MLRKICAALALAAVALSAHAEFPDRPITLIVPFPAGGPTDIVGRVAAAKAGEILGQQIVVENRTGASGTIGMAATARAKPDGYTVGLATVSTHGTAPHLFPKLAYDPVKDFTPISNLVTSPNILAVNPAFPAKDLAGFVAHVRANPGKDGYANAGAGGVNDLGMIWFLQIIDGKMNSISYRGSAPALTDTVAGVVPAIFDNFPSTLPYVKSGHLRALAITGNARNPRLPELPTFAELGYRDYDVTAWYGVVAPAGLPDAVRDKLAKAFAQAVRDPATAAKMEEAGAFPLGNTPAEFAAQIRTEKDRWQRVIQQADIKLQ
ncbi:tripartite tricarboxylate transporter substrate binding protein BugE [Bordetella hinzii]|uniref:Tripartite tricarboxylate transporter family receptor n=1 Tax=Bordetella hinzii OH87 BAL007II TaxID=1331262 RepID=A0ABR4QZN6_9BORD|nr:tripartite tricarboxylate transporter substrate binding protein BugE [Bordetella hinzii]KCB23375.1 tripartite tricarboxylate transporter family receptor [Bordetella hinzii OH87 BAL007II]KCB39575.1 tripartite tricarboxylate transporter family receptor [Bordetella hinzii 5132]MCJ9712467.1 tripartite tricarboxylate transporter substrate binding protein BugE [Bordetella hinzii]QDJ40070.1 tripartite tricarboxylate transporter substrate binding protein BugE [Bordetella hinzii]QDJ44588.1 tripartit